MLKHVTTLIKQTTLCLFILFSTGCDLLSTAEPEGNSGRIMIWHGWDETGHTALNELVSKYNSVHPEAAIVIIEVPPNELRARYESAATLGLGPDLLIGSSEWLDQFNAEQLITSVAQFDSDRFNKASLNLVTRNTTTYAIPLSLQAQVLYYNRNLVSEGVPQSYSELSEAASNGHIVAINTNADHAFLGIQAFGDALIETVETEQEQVQGQVLRLNPDGFLGWVNWLRDAQENPNFILSQDREALDDLFDAGGVSYYLGGYEYLAQHRNELRDRNVDNEETGENSSFIGTATLPSGEIGLSRPLLQAEVLYFNNASSERQYQLALDFATFLTNQEQSSFLLRELDFVPANQQVRVGRRVYPAVYPFTQSARVAVSVPLELKEVLTGNSADTVYTAILSGVQEPETAFCTWQEEISAIWEGLILSNDICNTETVNEE